MGQWYNNGLASAIMLTEMCEFNEHPYSPIANLRQPLPFWNKLRLVMTNNLLKLRRRQGCCGNYGQPGC